MTEEMEARQRRAGGQVWPSGPPVTAPTDQHAEQPPSAGTSEQPAYDPNVISNYAVSHLRTFVPLVWGAAISYAADRYVPAIPRELAGDPVAISAATSLATFAWYALWRKLEPRVPGWLVAIVLGHPSPPRYP